MLAKNPDDRMSVAQVLAHPWTKTHYPHPKNTIKNIDKSASSVLRTIKDSTMAPYLAQIYDEEIESELETRGFYGDIDAIVSCCFITLAFRK